MNSSTTNAPPAAKRDEKEELKAKAWDLWLDCYTEQAIAAETGVAQQTLSGWLTEKRKDPDFGKAPESRQHFDIWQFASANGASSYFGKMPPLPGGYPPAPTLSTLHP